MTAASSAPRRVGLVLSGGGARGAYEADVLVHLIEEVYPRLPKGFELENGAVRELVFDENGEYRPPRRAPRTIRRSANRKARPRTRAR